MQSLKAYEVRQNQILVVHEPFIHCNKSPVKRTLHSHLIPSKTQAEKREEFHTNTRLVVLEMVHA